jgi:hypothetical protein
MYRRYIILYNIYTATFGNAISLHPTPEKIKFHEVRQRFREGVGNKKGSSVFLKNE